MHRKLVRVTAVLLLTSLAGAFVLSTITFFFTRFALMDYTVNGDVFKDVGLFAASLGLRNEDRIGPQTPFFDRLWIAGGAPTHPVDQKKTVIVTRHGVPHVVTLRPDPSGVFNTGFEIRASLISKIFVFLAFAAVGTFLVLVRPRPLTWAFYIFTLGQTQPGFFVTERLLNLTMPAGFILNLMRFTYLTAGEFAFVAFVLLFPGDSAAGWRRTVLRGFLVFTATFYLWNTLTWFTQGNAASSTHLDIAANAFGPRLMPLLLVPNLVFGQPGAGSQTYVDLALWAGPLLIAIASLLGRYRASPPAERQRLVWAIVGVLLAYSTISLQIVAFILPAQFFTSNLVRALQAAAIFAPFILAYTILKHRVIDVRFVMSRAAVIAIIAAFMVGLFFGVDTLFAAFFANSRLQVALDFIFVAATAIILTRAYSKLVDFFDAVFFPVRREKLQQLQALRERIEEEQDISKLERLLNAAACEVLALSSSALFLQSSDGGFVREASVGWERGTTWHALRDDPIVATIRNDTAGAIRLDDDAWANAVVPLGPARPALVIPLRFQRKVCALQFYGAHLTGADLDAAEVRALKEICAGAAPAFGYNFGPQP